MRLHFSEQFRRLEVVAGIYGFLVARGASQRLIGPIYGCMVSGVGFESDSASALFTVNVPVLYPMHVLL